MGGMPGGSLDPFDLGGTKQRGTRLRPEDVSSDESDEGPQLRPRGKSHRVPPNADQQARPTFACAILRTGPSLRAQRQYISAARSRQSLRAANGTRAPRRAAKCLIWFPIWLRLGSRGRGRRAGFALLCCRGRPCTLANVCRPSVGSDSPCARCSESESCLYYR